MAEENRYEKNPKKLFWISFFFNLSALTSVITLFYLHRGLNFTQISLLGVIVSLAIILFEVPTGMISDIVGRKKSVIFGILLLLAHATVYIFAHNFIAFAIGILFFAVAITFFSGCITAIIYDSLKFANKESQAKKYIGRYRSAQILASIVIPPIASFVAKDLINQQFIVLIIINIVGYLIALFIALALHETPHKLEKTSKYGLLKDSFYQIVSNPSLLKLSFNQGLGFVCVLAFGALLWQPYFQQLNIPIAFFGTIFAISNVISFFLFRNVDKLENLFGFKLTLFLTSFLPGIFLILMIYYFSPITAIIGFSVILIFIPLRDPLFVDYKNRHITSHNRATTISIISMLYSLLAAIVQPIVGFLADINLKYAFAFLALILIFNPIIFNINEKDIVLKTDLYQERGVK